MHGLYPLMRKNQMIRGKPGRKDKETFRYE